MRVLCAAGLGAVSARPHRAQANGHRASAPWGCARASERSRRRGGAQRERRGADQRHVLPKLVSARKRPKGFHCASTQLRIPAHASSSLTRQVAKAGERQEAPKGVPPRQVVRPAAKVKDGPAVGVPQRGLRAGKARTACTWRPTAWPAGGQSAHSVPWRTQRRRDAGEPHADQAYCRRCCTQGSSLPAAGRERRPRGVGPRALRSP